MLSGSKPPRRAPGGIVTAANTGRRTRRGQLHRSPQKNRLRKIEVNLPTDVEQGLKMQPMENNELEDTDESARCTLLRFQNICNVIFKLEFANMVEYGKAKSLPTNASELPAIAPNATCGSSDPEVQLLYTILRQSLFTSVIALHQAVKWVEDYMVQHVSLLPFSVIGEAPRGGHNKWMKDERAISSQTIFSGYNDRTHISEAFWTKTTVSTSIYEVILMIADICSMATAMEQLETGVITVDNSQDRLERLRLLLRAYCACNVNLSKATSIEIDTLILQNLNADAQMLFTYVDKFAALGKSRAINFLHHCLDKALIGHTNATNTEDANLATWYELTVDIVPMSVMLATLPMSLKTHSYSNAFGDSENGQYPAIFDIYSYPALFASDIADNDPPRLCNRACKYVEQLSAYRDNVNRVFVFASTIEKWATAAFGASFTSALQDIRNAKNDINQFLPPVLPELQHLVDSFQTGNEEKSSLSKSPQRTGRSPGTASAVSPRKTMLTPDARGELMKATMPTDATKLSSEKFIELILGVIDKETSVFEHQQGPLWYTKYIHPLMELLSLEAECVIEPDNTGITVCAFGVDKRGGDNSLTNLYWPAQLYSIDLIYKFLAETTQTLISVFQNHVVSVISDTNCAVTHSLIHEVLWTSAMMETVNDTTGDILAAEYKVDDVARARDVCGLNTFQTELVLELASTLHQLVEKTIRLCQFKKSILVKRRDLRNQCCAATAHIRNGPAEAREFASNLDAFWSANMPTKTTWGADANAVVCISHREDLARFIDIFAEIYSYAKVDHPILHMTQVSHTDPVRDLSKLRELFSTGVKTAASQIAAACAQHVSEIPRAVLPKAKPLQLSGTPYRGKLDSLQLLPHFVTNHIALKEVIAAGGKTVDDIVRTAASTREKAQEFDTVCMYIVDWVSTETVKTLTKKITDLFIGEPTLPIISLFPSSPFDKILDDHLHRDEVNDVHRLVDAMVKTCAPLKFTKTNANVVKRIEGAISVIVNNPFQKSDIVKPRRLPLLNQPHSGEEESAQAHSLGADDVVFNAADPDASGDNLAVWKYSSNGLTRSQKSQVAMKIGVPGLKFVHSSNLLTATATRDESVAYEEARLVTGDSNNADLINHSMLVQILTMLLAYIPRVATAFFADKEYRDVNLEALVYYIDNRMQMKPISEMAMWTASSIVTYTQTDDWLSFLLSSLLGAQYANSVQRKLVRVPHTERSTWASEFLKQDLSNRALFDPDTTASYCVYEFTTYPLSPDFKPSLEDMRALRRALSKKYEQTAAGGPAVYPLCYVYTVHTTDDTDVNKRKSNMFHIIDSAHQIRENAHTRVHLMLAAMKKPAAASHWYRTLHNMPVRVCPACGFVRSENSMTADDFENHMYASRYQCASLQLFQTTGPFTQFQMRDVQRLKLADTTVAIVTTLTQMPVWKSVVNAIFTDQIRLNQGILSDLLDELVETLTPPLVRGRNPFFVALERKAGLSPSAFGYIKKFVEKILPQFTRLIKILNRPPSAIAKWSVPRLLQYHSKEMKRRGKSGARTHDATGYIRAIVWNQFVRFAVKILLLNLPMSSFTAPGLQTDPKLSIVDTLRRASNRPSAATVEFFSHTGLMQAECRTQLASDALTRDTVLANQSAADAARRRAAVEEKKRMTPAQKAEAKRAKEAAAQELRQKRAAAKKERAGKKADRITQKLQSIPAPAAAAAAEEKDETEPDDDDDASDSTVTEHPEAHANFVEFDEMGLVLPEEDDALPQDSTANASLPIAATTSTPDPLRIGSTAAAPLQVGADFTRVISSRLTIEEFERWFRGDVVNNIIETDDEIVSVDSSNMRKIHDAVENAMENL